MLTQDNVKLSVKSLQLYSALGFYPIEVPKSGLPALASATSPLRRGQTLLLCSVLYTVFMAIRLEGIVNGRTTENGTKANVYTLPLHVIMLVGATAGPIAYALLWRSSHAWLSVCLLLDLLKNLPRGMLPLTCVFPIFSYRSNVRKSFKIECLILAGGRNFDCILIRAVPFFYPFLCFFLETSKFITPRIPAFSMRSIVPTNTMLPIALVAHGTCAVIEITLVVFWISVGYYALLLQLLFFQRCQDDLRNWLEGVR